MDTEQIHTNLAKFKPYKIHTKRSGVMLCLLFPPSGGEIDEYVMMSLVPLNSNPENLHSTFYFTLPDVPSQPKPSTT